MGQLGMKILFDQGTPAPLRRELVGHMVRTAHEMGWDEKSNGELLALAEVEFQLLITTDKNLQYQQNLTGRNLAILVLPTTSWRVLKSNGAEILAAVNSIAPGEYRKFDLP